MTVPTFDAIVVGLGGMGSATLFELARRGLRVLGLEQFDLVHDRGSSHGLTRVIRTAYYEHPSYVPLVRRSFERWYDLEQVVGRRLLTECGCLNVGQPESSVVEGVRAAAREHGLSVEELGGSEIRRRFPALNFPDDYLGVLEAQAGYLYVEECVRAHLDAARQLGATIREREEVHEWKATANGVEVRSNRQTYGAAKLVLCAGPWAGKMLAGWGQPLRVMRQTQFWFGVRDPQLFRRDGFPIYLCEVPGGYFYGLPMIDANGHKVARHYGAPELTKPSDIVREITGDDQTAVRQFLDEFVPRADGPCHRAQVCTYTLTPDRHFILDVHPDHANVALAAGFSGHGFKFAAVVGEIMADFATAGATHWPVEMFRVTRFGPSPAGA